MDPLRSYPEEPEPRWFGNEPEDGYRVPEPRGAAPADRYADVRYSEPARIPTRGPGGPGGPPPSPAMAPGGPPPGAPPGPVGRRSGEPLPPLSADPPPRERHHTEAIDRGALRRPGSDGIYRARRPAVAVLVGAVAGTAAVLILVALIQADLTVSGAISSALILLGLPLGALGMYGLITGAARVPDVSPLHAWLRPPLAYLAVALVLLLAAGLAAG